MFTSPNPAPNLLPDDADLLKDLDVVLDILHYNPAKVSTSSSAFLEFAVETVSQQGRFYESQSTNDLVANFAYLSVNPALRHLIKF